MSLKQPCVDTPSLEGPLLKVGSPSPLLCTASQRTQISVSSSSAEETQGPFQRVCVQTRVRALRFTETLGWRPPRPRALSPCGDCPRVRFRAGSKPPESRPCRSAGQSASGLGASGRAVRPLGNLVVLVPPCAVRVVPPAPGLHAQGLRLHPVAHRERPHRRGGGRPRPASRGTSLPRARPSRPSSSRDPPCWAPVSLWGGCSSSRGDGGGGRSALRPGVSACARKPRAPAGAPPETPGESQARRPGGGSTARAGEGSLERRGNGGPHALLPVCSASSIQRPPDLRV